MASAPAIREPRFGSSKEPSNFGAALRKLYAAAFPRLNGIAATPKDPCNDIPSEKTALERALLRASGTWGGFQASRPFTHLPRD